jgi:hypothetical protein
MKNKQFINWISNGSCHPSKILFISSGGSIHQPVKAFTQKVASGAASPSGEIFEHT